MYVCLLFLITCTCFDYIGYQTALNLASHGAHVILACRNGMKAEEAVSKIKRLHVCGLIVINYVLPLFTPKLQHVTCMHE